MSSVEEATAVATFCRQIRARSTEHQRAIHCLHRADLHGQVVAILRQELDSMVRVIYLLSVADRRRRLQLVKASIEGKEWTHASSHRRITDSEMVKLSDRLTGWSKSVYRFGCAFIHLSSFHDYRDRDPMQMISEEERQALVEHMRYYHFAALDTRSTFLDVVEYLPDVFAKIASNLEHYLRDLEGDGDLQA